MTINRPLLNRNVAKFLRSPGGDSFFDSAETSLPERVLSTVICLGIACISLISVILIPIGIGALWRVLSGESFSDPWRKLRHDPDRLYPMIAYGIIMGPQGHALVLGTFDEELEQHPEFLAAKSQELAGLYMEGARHPRQAEIVKLLKDDTYRPDRRRRVIEPQAEGQPLYLFDVRLDTKQVRTGPKTSILVACVVTPGKEGVIQQIPWQVVESAVRV